MFSQLKRFFYFHKRERNGVGVLLVFIGLMVAVNCLMSIWIKPSIDHGAIQKFLELQKQIQDSIEVDIKHFSNKAELENENAENKLPITQAKSFNPFYFNPNTVTEEELLKMGFNNRFVRSFINYRSKGKIFKTPDDFSSVYGLTEVEFEKVKPFLTFPEADNVIEKAKELEIQKRKELVLVDVNTADTTMLMKLKGIGPAFAKRIVTYRNKLGGFYAKEQLLEVWGIDSALFNYIEPFVLIGPNIRQMDINTVGIEQLKNHPYLNFSVANNIIQIRNRLGRFNKIEEIKKSVLLKPEVFEKLKPYLTISNE